MRVPPISALALSTAAVALIVSGCNDSTGDTINQATSTDPAAPLFGADSGNVSGTPWQVPEFALSYHSESTTASWVIDAAVAGNIRPGIADQGLIASGTREDAIDGQMSYDRTTFNNVSVVRESLINFLTRPGAARRLAHSEKIIYDQTDFSLSWNLYLPSSVSIGTTWRSDLYQNDLSAKAFAYRPLETIAFRPRLHTVDGALAAGTDPAVVRTRVVADPAGNAVTDPALAGIDYASGPGYAGKWITLQPSSRCTVVGLNRTTPDGRFGGCVEVALTVDYLATTAIPAGSTLLGRDDYVTAYTLFWKPGIGWVSWSGMETRPSWGLTAIPAPTDDATGNTLNATAYNSSYDNSNFGPGSYPTGIFQGNYAATWRAGFIAAYTDQSPTVGSGRAARQEAYQTYLVANRLADSASSPDGSQAAFRRIADQAFLAGYDQGLSFYVTDYQETPNDYDTLITGRSDRKYTELSFNLVPAEFRPDGIWQISPGSRSDLLAGRSATGASYPHGYDGMGEIVDAYDPSVTVNPAAIRLARDANGRALTGVYISLPIRNAITTRTIRGAVTRTGLASGGNG